MKLLLSSLVIFCSSGCFAQECFIDFAQGNFASKAMNYEIHPYEDGTTFSDLELIALGKIETILPEFLKDMDTLDYIEKATRGKRLTKGASGVYYKIERKIEIGDLGVYEREGRLASPFYKVVVHEMAHAFDQQERISTSWQWMKLYRNEGTVTGYAKSAPEEDFAESMAFFILDPDLMLAEAPAKFEYISENYFDGKRFDTVSLLKQYESVLANLSGEERAQKIAQLKREDYYACKVLANYK